jgi:Transposase domain (DUF772)
LALLQDSLAVATRTEATKPPSDLARVVIDTTLRRAAVHDLSDEVLCERWVENPYFQYFCGEEFFQHR